MRKYLSSLIFVCGCLVFSYHEALSIRHMTETWAWHIFQVCSVALFLLAGVEFGRWLARGKFMELHVSDIGGNFLRQSPLRLYNNKFNFHDFGRIAGASLLGVVAYPFVLHFLLARM